MSTKLGMSAVRGHSKGGVLRGSSTLPRRTRPKRTPNASQSVRIICRPNEVVSLEQRY
jgi:hypothetical protein